MKYKLIAVDIDGTLLDSNGTITEVTKNAIKTAVDSGIVFVICSGRSIQGVEYLNSELSLDLPFITYNGAMIVMGKSKEVLYEQRLSQNDAEII
ncbi:MAG: HAD-IIB family hydrolase, partial [Alkaliphilus sp.]|nr:HAD-IIB family hydrolase [Alkaliphilus sp.]